MIQRIYLDNNATTELDPRVRKVIEEELASPPSNPSSIHFFGQEARKRLSKARQTIADFFQVKPSELIFTSGGTEALNMLLRGFFAENFKGHLITSDIEHSSVYQTVKALEKCGVRVTYLSTGTKGYVSPEDVSQAVSHDTRLVILGAVNSETGVKNPIAEIATLCATRTLPFLVDGVALLGKEPFTIPQGVSAMAFSAHKFHGPKGIGFAFVRKSFPYRSLLTGGDQEYAKRAGTENLPGIVGLAKAIELLSEELPSAETRMKTLRDHFEKSLRAHFPDLIVHGNDSPRVGNTSCLAFPGIDGETLLLHLDMQGVMASHGSACAAGALEPSRVLLNMGTPPALARSTLRFSLSRFTTQEEIDRAMEILSQIIKTARPSC